MMRTARPVLVIGALLLAACADRTTPGADGATASAALEEWSADATPVVSIQGVDEAGDPLIASVEGVTRLPGGEIVVADAALRSIRWFDAQGHLLRSVGGGADGNPAFRFITGLLRCGDSLYVKDWAGNPPMRVYSPDGAFVRAFSFDAPYLPDGCNAQQQFVRMGGASITTPPVTPQSGQATYALYDAKGDLSTVLGTFRSTEYVNSEALGSRPRPLGRETLLAMGRDRVYIGTADSFIVQEFRTTGERLGALRYDDVDLSTTPDDIERYKYLDTVASSANQNEKKLRVLHWDTIDFPPTIPAYDAMLVDARDMLWVRRMPRRIGGNAEWIVFSPDGAPVARLALPGDLRVHEVGDEYLAGVRALPGTNTPAVQVYTLCR